MRKTKRNRTLKEDRKNDYPVIRKYKGKNYDNAVCKNAEFVKEKLEKDIAIEVIVNKGCKNLRADASSHCAPCSKKYAKENK